MFVCCFFFEIDGILCYLILDNMYYLIICVFCDKNLSVWLFRFKKLYCFMCCLSNYVYNEYLFNIYNVVVLRGFGFNYSVLFYLGIFLCFLIKLMVFWFFVFLILKWFNGWSVIVWIIFFMNKCFIFEFFYKYKYFMCCGYLLFLWSFSL